MHEGLKPTKNIYLNYLSQECPSALKFETIIKGKIVIGSLDQLIYIAAFKIIEK